MSKSARATEIKADIVAGLTQPVIAAKYKVSRSLVSDIATGRAHKNAPWPDDHAPKKRAGGQRKALHDATDDRIMELEEEILHLTDERNREKGKNKKLMKTSGLFKALVNEMETRIQPMTALPGAYEPLSKAAAIDEHFVMHMSDGHFDQVIKPEECGGLEEYNFPIACARAERYVDTVLEWTTDTLAPKFNFTHLWFLAYGDHTSGEIHGHGQRSYYRNTMKNCLAIGQLQAMMLRDLAPHFGQVHAVYLSGNHGRRTVEKDYHGAHDNFDYLIAELTRMNCRDIPNVDFIIPDAWSVNLDINGVGFNVSHGDDVKGAGGVPFYGMLRRQKGLIALNSMQQGLPMRYFVMGHHHCASSLADVKGELIVNGAWPGTDAYAYNRFSGYREPSQLIHGVNPKHGLTWRMNVKIKHDAEKRGPKRYIIDGGRDVGPLAA